MLKELVTFSVTEGSLCFLSFIFLIALSGTSAEFFCDKFLWKMLHSDSLTSLDLFFDKVSCTMIYFDSSSSVTLTFDDGAVFSV